MTIQNQKLPLIVVIISLTFLNAKCSLPQPSVEDTEQCSTFFAKYENSLIDVENSVCNCRMYRFTKDYLGAISYTDKQLERALELDTENQIISYKPKLIVRKLSYCHAVVGWSSLKRSEDVSPYARVTAFWDQLRIYLLKQ